MPGLAGPGSDEQSLVIEIEGGALVITGCAHPGIVKVVRKAAELVPGKPLTLIGGFHLLRLKDEEVLTIIGDLKAAGVVRCGATHCTGDAAIGLFKREFGKDFLDLGVGRVLEFAP
jgi:7,8-dihydropterin-6-yl-methyl-4-(beta-D-ribofuranosyl)aminobenzene 5'-phosphate synthase